MHVYILYFLKNIVLSEDNNWEYTFTDLPLYESGEVITYNIVEKDVPDDYVVAYEGDIKSGFITHNILG